MIFSMMTLRRGLAAGRALWSGHRAESAHRRATHL
jgi:hypothetical protein